MSSPCNSHVVPKFILKSLAENGSLFFGQTLYKYSTLIESKKGVNNAFNFHLICKKCDNSYFKSYEDPKIVLNFNPSNEIKKNKLLCEMAIKSLLASLSIKMYLSELKSFIFNFAKKAEDLDIKNYLNRIRYIKKCKNSEKELINIIYDKLLDYEVKIACQCILAIVRDINGDVCFDIKDFSEYNNINYLYLNILPYQGKTRIILFNFKYDKPDNNTNLIKQFNELNDEEKLKFIFVALTMYSEQFLLAPSFKDLLKKDKKLVKMYSKTDNRNSSDIVFKEFKNFRKYENYLSEKYKKNI